MPTILTVPKLDGQPNEDAFCRSFRGVHALSDGASISFDSVTWSRMLVRRYVRDPNFGPDWLSHAAAEFARLYERDSLPWMKQASFDQGSFASLLGIRMEDDGKRIRLLAIGDSLAVLCDGDAIKATFPYVRAEEFERSPQLLSTNPVENAFLAETRYGELTAEWTFNGLSRPALLCMTDALGHWLLSWRDTKRSPVAILRNLGGQADFTRFVCTERAAGRMRRDDTTLMAIW
ncbi:MAG TPA: hypothetical protein VKZ79_15980 [Alphaproteobacteria bacterium]|nr:hypothetical protein [Alphaproteobacteria bacterium]